MLEFDKRKGMEKQYQIDLRLITALKKNMPAKISRLGLFMLVYLNAAGIYAQNPAAASVTGEYMLEGVMETAAGFRINSNGTFEYGFTYGAADKSGKGNWKQVGNTLILNSLKTQPATDFILKNSASTNQKGVTIKITDAKGNAYSYVKCRLSEGGGQEATTDNRGEVHFATIGSGMLELYHPIFSTRISKITLNPKHNQFTIFPAYDLSEVFFKDFKLEIQPNQVSSKILPGMPPEDAGGQKKRYVFSKQK